MKETQGMMFISIHPNPCTIIDTFWIRKLNIQHQPRSQHIILHQHQLRFIMSHFFTKQPSHIQMYIAYDYHVLLSRNQQNDQHLNQHGIQQKHQQQNQHGVQHQYQQNNQHTIQKQDLNPNQNEDHD